MKKPTKECSKKDMAMDKGKKEKMPEAMEYKKIVVKKKK